MYIILNNNKKKNITSIGQNIVLDEHESYHSMVGKKTVESVFPDFNHKIIESCKIIKNTVSASKTRAFSVLFEADIYSHPYVDGAREEDINSTPDILHVGSHYSNDFIRKDITRNEKEFLKNTIAVGARADNTTDNFGSSYGFGIEFFETANNVSMDERFPRKHKHIIGWGTISEDRRTLTFTSLKKNRKLTDVKWLTYGKKIALGNSDKPAIIRNVESFDDYTITVDEPFENFTPKRSLFFWACDIKIGSIWLGFTSQQNVYQQSPTCNIVTAKLKQIQQETGADWQTIRKACRLTASNSTFENGKWITHWDMYRGFGMIDVQRAIAYINENK